MKSEKKKTTTATRPRPKGRAENRKLAVIDDDMPADLSHLDWSKAERGKYAKRFSQGTNVVLIEPDLLELFPDADAVNRALRVLSDIIRTSRAKTQPPKRTTRRRKKA